MELALIQAILAGLTQAPQLISSATTLVDMFSKGEITESELQASWTTTVANVKAAESAWKAAHTIDGLPALIDTSRPPA